MSRHSFGAWHDMVRKYVVPCTELCRAGAKSRECRAMYVLPCMFLCFFIQLGVVPCMSLYVSTVSCHEVCRAMYRALKYVVPCHGTTYFAYMARHGGCRAMYRAMK